MRHNILYLTTTLLLVLTALSCKDDNTSIEGFWIDAQSIEAEAAGGEYRIAIRSSKEWTAVAAAPWVMISPANGRGEVECIVKIDSTLVNDTRLTDIRFSSGGELLQQVAVSQSGYAPSIVPDTTLREIASSARRDDRWFETEITTNVPFDIATEYDGDQEWLSVEEYTLTLDRGARPRTTRLRFNWKMNSQPEERVAKLHLTAKGGDQTPSTTITIRQQAAPRIEDNREGDSLAIMIIYERLECWSDNGISSTEGMHRWDCVRLWEATDKDLPSSAAIGRVRDLDLSYFRTEEGIPQEIRYLKYLETLSLFGNVNTMLKSIEMGEEVCELEYLKALRVAAYGISKLPANFIKLGDTLETLDLNSNNLNSIPEVLTEENFPKLRSLNLSSNRRKAFSDLRKATDSEEGIGLRSNLQQDDDIERLLRWEALEELALSYNYIEGELPDFTVGEDGVRAYTADDVRDHGDTLRWAVENNLPRILPNMRNLRLNLNFLSGKLPDWLLYHPRLMEWSPVILLYQQQEAGIDSEGRNVGFSNVPTSFEEYFERYPLYRGRYEFNDETE